MQNGARPEEIAQSQATVDAAKATLTYAEARFMRVESLFKDQSYAVTEDERSLARAEHLRAQEALKEAEAKHALLVEGPRKEQIAQAAARKAMQDKLSKNSRTVLASTRFGRRSTVLSWSSIPRSGSGSSKGKSSRKSPRLDTVEVEVYLPEDFIRFVHLGTEVTVQIESLARSFPGRVARIVPQADPRSRTFPIKIDVHNDAEDGQRPIKSGMLARVELAVGDPMFGMFVPKDALVLGGETPVVWVVDVDAKARARRCAASRGAARSVVLRPDSDSWTLGGGPAGRDSRQ